MEYTQKYRTREEVRADVISRRVKTIEDLNNRLCREGKRFDERQAYIKDYKERYFSEDHTNKTIDIIISGEKKPNKYDYLIRPKGYQMNCLERRFASIDRSSRKKIK